MTVGAAKLLAKLGHERGGGKKLSAHYGVVEGNLPLQEWLPRYEPNGAWMNLGQNARAGCQSSRKASKALILSQFSQLVGSPSFLSWLTKWLEGRLQTISCS
ncbi:hypothetical protein [Microvirga ossetica]|uniref:hypothetical protein n=1 Tax=Microvirga ossetica TaxID=1882682 RepID=UPI0012FFF49B|nr:hypothetical protein [Microvirga ossetica]